MNEELAARYLDGETLDPADLALLADDRALLDDLAVMLADDDLWEEPPASLEDDIVGIIRAEANQANPQAPKALAPSALPDNVIPLSAARRRTVRTSLLSAAAAAVVAVGITAAVTRDGGPAGPANQVEVALPDGNAGGVQVADTASGLRIHLDAPHLERLPDGQFYQAWLRSVDGKRLVTVGTFHSGTDVTLWAGVALKDFPTLTVTIESDDGDPASSGNRVLAVPLLGS